MNGTLARDELFGLGLPVNSLNPKTLNPKGTYLMVEDSTSQQHDD